MQKPKFILNYNTYNVEYQEILSAMLNNKEVVVWMKNLSVIESRNYV